MPQTIVMRNVSAALAAGLLMLAPALARAVEEAEYRVLKQDGVPRALPQPCPPCDPLPARTDRRARRL